MNNRILEIIEFIEERMADSPELAFYIMEELITEGYNQDEIEEAITWIETYQQVREMESFFEISKNFQSINVKDDAYNYLVKSLEDGLIDDEYFDDLLSYCLLKDYKEIDLQKIISINIELKSIKFDLAKEARANFRAYSNNKDC
ncbi:MAG: hypothetical protein N2999_07065 [Proteobacteria bacterium]|nr:hypothetical protein [Pseudomonadota bacterium]